MPADPLFLYGTLRHAPTYAAVAGAPLAGVRAHLPDHAVLTALGTDGRSLNFPMFAPRPGAVAEGLLVQPAPAERARLDAYERVFGYEPAPIGVQTEGGVVDAVIYLPDRAMWQGGDPWQLDVWAAQFGAFNAEVAAAVMALIPEARPEAVLQRYGMLAAHVASRRRARAEPAPASLRRRPQPGDIETVARRQPYAWFFGVEEADLRFRRFDGAPSPAVTRAGFVMADAVTVLPYDPVRDTVMLVEQFRFGPHLRGDPNAWSLEPIAGRIDPHETPEAAVRREAAEEARLTLSVLHPVGRYYVSPGAVTEYILSYVGIADLPASAEGVSGLESEAEDIRSHVIPYARLVELLDSGEVENAPLLISTQWLMRNRSRLRA